MRFLPPLLHRLFKPVPFMDAQTRMQDPIARDVEMAVSENVRSGAERNAEYERLLETMDDLFKRMGKHDDVDG